MNTMIKTLLFALLTVSTGAFVVAPSKTTSTPLNAAKQNGIVPAHVKAAAFVTLVTVSQPLIALAEEVDDYEYGGNKLYCSFLFQWLGLYFFY